MLDGFWLDVKIFMAVEVVVLVARPRWWRSRARPGARALPVAPARRHLHRHLPRRAGDPGRLPDRVRRAGARAVAGCPATRSCSAASRWRSATRAYVAEVYRAGIDSVHPSQTLGRARARAHGRRSPRASWSCRRRPPRDAAAPERLHRAPEGRGARLDPRPARGVPGGPDRRLARPSTTRRCSPPRRSTWP